MILYTNMKYNNRYTYISAATKKSKLNCIKVIHPLVLQHYYNKLTICPSSSHTHTRWFKYDQDKL